MSGYPEETRNRPVATILGLAVLAALVGAVTGLVLLAVRTGGLGLALVAVPTMIVMIAVGYAGWALLRGGPTRMHPARLVSGLVLCVAAVLVLTMVAMIGFGTPPTPGA